MSLFNQSRTIMIWNRLFYRLHRYITTHAEVQLCQALAPLRKRKTKHKKYSDAAPSSLPLPCLLRCGACREGCLRPLPVALFPYRSPSIYSWMLTAGLRYICTLLSVSALLPCRWPSAMAARAIPPVSRAALLPLAAFFSYAHIAPGVHIARVGSFCPLLHTPPSRINIPQSPLLHNVPIQWPTHLQSSLGEQIYCHVILSRLQYLLPLPRPLLIAHDFWFPVPIYIQYLGWSNLIYSRAPHQYSGDAIWSPLYFQTFAPSLSEWLKSFLQVPCCPIVQVSSSPVVHKISCKFVLLF
jgi:hypothetical protein